MRNLLAWGMRVSLPSLQLTTLRALPAYTGAEGGRECALQQGAGAGAGFRLPARVGYVVAYSCSARTEVHCILERALVVSDVLTPCEPIMLVASMLLLPLSPHAQRDRLESAPVGYACAHDV